MNLNTYYVLAGLTEAHDTTPKGRLDAAQIFESSDADEWVESYIDETGHSSPSADIIHALLQDYPYTDNSVVYRGLNFKNEDQYNEFLHNTQNGTTLSTESVTSWSKKPSVAENFSITRPTYFLNTELMQAEDIRAKNRDFMIGRAGVILKIHPTKGSAIDLTKTNKSAEDEVILIPGKYHIEIHKINIPFVHSIDDQNYEDVLHEIKSLDDKFDKQKFDHILYRFTEFSDKTRQKIWELLKFDPHIGVYVGLDEAYSPRDRQRLYVRMGILPSVMYLYKLLLPKHQEIILNSLRVAAKEIKKQIDAILPSINFEMFVLIVDRNTKLCEAITGIDIFSNVDARVTKAYHSLNSLSTVRNINALSGEEKQTAMKQYSADILQIVRNLSKDM